MRTFGFAVVSTALAIACAPSRHAAPSAPAPAPAPAIAHPTPPAPPRVATPLAPPAAAFRAGWMPLDPTGVREFRRLHPTYDGRGVLIGVLDSGIDPGVDGLRITATGDPKIVDLRDFSGEGRIPLTRLTPRGDTLAIAGRRLLGASRVAALAGSQPVYGGVLREIALGGPPAADLNGNGEAKDTLPVIVAQATDGWVLLADTDGDGSLANERPVHDYLRTRETFGWHAAGRPTPLTLAVNLSDGPTLDLYFDTSGHGTHVAGIAAGHDMYGVAGFDGVAPGAQLLGLKIADDAQGGITTSGSMLRAIDYAIRVAEARAMPLVLNMSFGVGNEIEGQATIDLMIDSVLAVHPNLVFSISAGNDGPGLSTVGFPGSATRALGVGALFPSAFVAPGSGHGGVATASFSSRGGELAKPDLITPGLAYSTVPRWDTGNEVKTGTSMASPHAAGLAALLVSALKQESAPIDGRRIKQALMVTAQPQLGATYLDEGTGVPDVGRAHRWLEDRRPLPEVAVRAVAGGVTAVYAVRGVADTVARFELTAASGSAGTYRLRSDSPWLLAPKSVTLGGGPSAVGLTWQPGALAAEGAHVAVVTGWSADTLAGPAFRLIVTVVTPEAAGDRSLTTGAIAAGGLARVFFPADSGRPFRVQVATGPGQAALASLHEPHGQPYRDRSTRTAGAGDEAAVFLVDGRDVRSGLYEIDVAAPPAQSTSATVTVAQSPMTIAARRGERGLVVSAVNLTDVQVNAEIHGMLAGAERRQRVDARGSDTQRIPFEIPAWAKTVEVDLSMDPRLWSRFTDFGLTLFDSTGQQIAQSPLNYATGRLTADLPADHGPIHAQLGLFPGFAEPNGEPWSADVAMRVYADSAMMMEPAGSSSSASVAPGKSVTETFTLPPLPWPLADGFDPLCVVVVDAADTIWTREVAVPSPLHP